MLYVVTVIGTFFGICRAVAFDSTEERVKDVDVGHRNISRGMDTRAPNF